MSQRSVFGHFALITEVGDICPLNNVSVEIAAVATTLRDIEAHTGAIIAVFERYVSYYDDVVTSSLVSLFTLLGLTLGRVGTGVFSQQLDATRFHYVSAWLQTCFNATAVSFGKEFVLLITLVLVSVLIVGFRAIAAVGVTVCPDVGTLEHALEASGLLAVNTTSEGQLIPRELFDYFLLCPVSANHNPFGFDLNESTDAFFDGIYELGFECSANSTLTCSNHSLPCGLYETNSNSSNLEFVCPCSEYMQDVSKLLTDCNGTASLLIGAFETYFCSQFVQGSALIYISGILVLLSTLFLMIVFRMLSEVLSKLTDFPDFG